MNIIEVSTSGEMDAVRDLRRAVFVVEQKVPEDLEWDGLDGQARHLLAVVADQPAGTLRWRVVGDAGKVERVCVAADQRGSGLGRKLMERVLADIRATPGLRRVKLGAQVSAIPFYESLGFKAYGPVFDDAGIPHRDMELEV